MMHSAVIGMTAALILTLAAPAAAQPSGGHSGGDGEARKRVVYEREVFHYEAAGRRDPFRSLLEAEDVGVRANDLVLAGILHDSDPRRSVAMIAEQGTSRRFRVRVGDRVDGIRIQAIHPDRVDLLVEELGVMRRESLQLPRPNRQRANR